MLVLSVILEGDGAWPDLAEKARVPGGLVWLGAATPEADLRPIQVAALSRGMRSGRPSVAIRIDLPDGRVVVAETSMRLFMMAADAFRVRFGDPRTWPEEG